MAGNSFPVPVQAGGLDVCSTGGGIFIQHGNMPPVRCLERERHIRNFFVCAGSLFPRLRRAGQALRACARAALLCCLLLVLAGCTLRSGTVPSGPSVAGQSISRTALSTVGTRYASGGTTPHSGFDCSGLVCWAFAQNGLSMPRTAREQSKIGTSVGKKHLREGDLVVFAIRGGMHTGIYTGRGKFVHSPSRGKTVREDRLDSDYWRKRFVAGRRHHRTH